MTKETCDVLVLGAGIVGLAVGIAILENRPHSRVLVVDKESNFGMHASGRNSGVLHAGFYYSPDSLKAKFCREGNLELKKLCKTFEIPVKECGKVVLTQNEEEENRLDELHRRGVENGVELEILEREQLSKYEPLAVTHRRFMWSPNTAISDSHSVLEAMARKFSSIGGILKFNSSLEFVNKNGEIRDQSGQIQFRQLVNCSGAQADRLAKRMGVQHEYAMVPFMGIYRSVAEKQLPLRTLVYPVPHSINPFLGVHFTLTIDGKVKIGPTAIPILGREQYSLMSGWSGNDIKEALRGTYSLLQGKTHDFSEIVRQEWPKLLQKKLVSDGSKLVPMAKNVKGWIRKPPGIRAQLVHTPTGKLEQDFVVTNYLNTTHILNAVSPGWTSAIPFGRYISSEFVIPKLS